MKDWNFVFAGFGGQGILFAGKVVAYAGMMEEREVSWLPSYGPEMRGGTANCSVCLSSRPIGSPLVLEPDALVVMNNPSYDKFINTVAPGGVAVIDSALVDRKTSRTDITALYVPATKLAQENGMGKLANLIMLGAAGKGFAVVAQEIGALAVNTNEAANEIQTMSKDVVEAIWGLDKLAEQMLSLLEESISSDYETFGSASQKFTDRSQEITDSMEKLQEYTEKYADSMEKIKDAMASVGAASEEGSKEMIQVSELLSSIDVDMKNIEHLTGETFSDISVMNRDLGSYQV